MWQLDTNAGTSFVQFVVLLVSDRPGTPTLKARRTKKLLAEPPASATGDIAFNLIVFFLVCASVQPDSGRKQSIPKSETIENKSEQLENVEVLLKRSSVAVNGDFIPVAGLRGRIAAMLAGKPRPEDRVVIVKSDDDVPYHHWIAITTQIEDAGGIITLQIEEERTVEIPQ